MKTLMMVLLILAAAVMYAVGQTMVNGPSVCQVDANGKVMLREGQLSCRYPPTNWSSVPAISLNTIDCGMVNGVLVSKPCKEYAEELAKRLDAYEPRKKNVRFELPKYSVESDCGRLEIVGGHQMSYGVSVGVDRKYMSVYNASVVRCAK